MYYLYRITNILNNKVYIGQSNKENERWRQHKYFARQDEPVQYIHRAMKKYGTNNFVYEVIVVCRTREDADETEKQLVIQYDSRNKEHGYNIALGGNVTWQSGLPPHMYPMYGKHHTEESRQKISESNMGKKIPHSEEWSGKVSASLTGHVVTEETRQKISQSKLGSHYSEDARKKMSESKMGIKMPVETKLKMSLAKLGKKKNKQTRDNMSLAQRKFSATQELEIVKLYNSGIGAVELSAVFNCHVATIYNILKRNK